jgi:hypothetical protein
MQTVIAETIIDYGFNPKIEFNGLDERVEKPELIENELILILL